MHILEALGVSPDDVVLRVSEAIPPQEQVMHNMPFDRVLSPGAQRALSLATREAARLGHTYIGNEHLLHGLAAEDEGVAAQVLAGLGVDPDAIRGPMPAC